MADTKISALSALAAALDLDELLAIVDDPSGTPANLKMALRALAWGRPQVPYFTDSGVYLGPPVGSFAGSGTAVTLTVNVLYLVPIIVPYRRAFTKIAFVCQTGAASAYARFGIWNANQNTAKPTTLVAEATGGTYPTDVSTNGVKEHDFAQTLDPGLYYGGVVVDTAAVAMRGGTTGHVNVLGFAPSGANLNTITHLNRAFTYGALGDESASTWTIGTGTGYPIVVIK